MTPERRERLKRAVMRAANIIPVCAQHVSTDVYLAQLDALSDEQLQGTIQTLEFIIDEALGTDAG